MGAKPVTPTVVCVNHVVALTHTVNVQLPEKQHFIKDYQIFTKSLVLVRFDKGRQAEYRVLNDTSELVGDKPAMQGYVEREVRDYLKRLP